MHAECRGSYLAVYISLLCFGVTMYCTSYLVYTFGVLRASRIIHKTLLQSVLSSTLRYVLLPNAIRTRLINTHLAGSIKPPLRGLSLAALKTSNAVRASCFLLIYRLASDHIP